MQETNKQQAELLINQGFNFHQQGLLDDAEPLYTEALKIDDTNAEIYNLIGVLKLQKGQVDEAIDYSMKAISISPSEYFYETLFQSSIRKEDFESIIGYEDTINNMFPNSFALNFNLGFAFKKLKQNQKAIKYYEKALKINPSSYEGWFNIANLYNMENRINDAISASNICCKIRPNNPETQYFLSLDYMKAKNYAKGLPLFENRFSKKVAVESLRRTNPSIIRDDNEWNGHNIKNKDILVFSEAGFGDNIMFLRYLPLVAKRCKKLTFMCQNNLTELLKNNKHLGFDELIDTFIPNTKVDADVYASILSLPYLLGLKGNDVFANREGYIVPDMDMVEDFRQKYFDNDKIKVGIKWHGNTFFDRERVIPAEYFNRLIDLGNAQYYSFQTFEGSEEINKLNPSIIDIGKDLTNFNQTAAALRNLDLVICNDTSLVHLAGAMRVPCWVMLPYNTNWRWHTDLSNCDWYESVKLFRQKNIDDWQSVFDQIIQEMGVNE